MDLSDSELDKLWGVVATPAEAMGAQRGAVPVWLVADVCAGVWSEAVEASVEVAGLDGGEMEEERVQQWVDMWIGLAEAAWPSAEAVGAAAAEAGGLDGGSSSPERREWSSRLRRRRSAVFSPAMAQGAGAGRRGGR